MRLYFAGPLFSDAERAFNADLAAAIERLGIEVFLPQRDGVERDLPPYDQMPADERRTRMFVTDRDEVLACDVFLIVTDGRVSDEGAAVSSASPTPIAISPAVTVSSSGFGPTRAQGSRLRRSTR